MDWLSAMNSLPKTRDLVPDNAGWVDLAVRWIRRKQAAPADSR